MICRLGFRGKGYNKVFVENMKAVLNELIYNPSTPIRVVQVTDDLCAKCPNNQWDTCVDNDDDHKNNRMIKMDQYVLSILGLKPNQEYLFSEIEALIGKHFNGEHMNQLCYKCEWRTLGYCDEGLHKIIKKYQKDLL